MQFDHYAIARSIADQLLLEGHDEWSEKILAAINDGSTGSEIFMALRWLLRELLKTEIAINPATVLLIHDLHSELDKSLS